MTREERKTALHVIKKFSSVWEFDEEEEKAIDNIIDELEQEPTTKNDLGVDCISRAEAIRVASGYCHPSNVAKELAKLPSVTPQEPVIDKIKNDMADIGKELRTRFDKYKAESEGKE